MAFLDIFRLFSVKIDNTIRNLSKQTNKNLNTNVTKIDQLLSLENKPVTV